MTPLPAPTYKEPETEEDYIEAEGLALYATASLVPEITTAEEFQAAGAIRKNIAERIAAFKDWFRPLKAAADRAHKVLVLREKEVLSYPEAALKALDAKLLAWDTKQRAERALMAQRAEEAVKVAQEVARRDGVEAAPLVVAAPLPPAPVSTDVGFTGRFKAVVRDMDALISACCPTCHPGQGRIDPNALQANQVLLNDWARAQRTALKVPGVEAVEERGVRGR